MKGWKAKQKISAGSLTDPGKVASKSGAEEETKPGSEVEIRPGAEEKAGQGRSESKRAFFEERIEMFGKAGIYFGPP